jgi:hypothetical protein
MQIPQDVVRSMFRQVWKDFYDWERVYCQSIIEFSAFSSNSARSSDNIIPSRNLSASRSRTKTIRPPPQPSLHTIDPVEITILDYTQGKFPVETRAMVEVVNVPNVPTPPVYESVTPATRSIHQGDDDDSMAFVPYSDDPTFDALDHTLQYKSFSWQDRFCDPDGECPDNDKSF